MNAHKLHLDRLVIRRRAILNESHLHLLHGSENGWVYLCHTDHMDIGLPISWTTLSIFAAPVTFQSEAAARSTMAKVLDMLTTQAPSERVDYVNALADGRIQFLTVRDALRCDSPSSSDAVNMIDTRKPNDGDLN